MSREGPNSPVGPIKIADHPFPRTKAKMYGLVVGIAIGIGQHFPLM